MEIHIKFILFFFTFSVLGGTKVGVGVLQLSFNSILVVSPKSFLSVLLSFLLDLSMGFCLLQGYDVVAIACPDRYVVGLDISEVALERAKEVTTYFPNAVFVPSH